MLRYIRGVAFARWLVGRHSHGTTTGYQPRMGNDLIKTGNSVPIITPFNALEDLYKIVPKGESVTTYTPFFITKAQLDALETSINIEQQLGLPLISHAVEYDVFKITATQQAKAFETTIANTVEKTYLTSGGGKQMLVIDRSKWSVPVKVKPLIPNL